MALIYKLHHVGRTGFDLEKSAVFTTVKKHLILKYMAILNEKLFLTISIWNYILIVILFKKKKGLQLSNNSVRRFFFRGTVSKVLN